ncbi:MAG: translocation/assembly module TamB domain-containing protein [Pseudooceanicola sp.]|nr:translocation/assembly module TamB domain-containing protein [Pseudooceanicola sp.]
MRRLLVLSTCLTLATPLAGQERGGFIVEFLEDSLSGDNRFVTVTGLEGALSSRATLQQLTVADDEGVWLTINNAVLDWNRSDLLRGNLNVNNLSAESIVVARPPGTTGGDLPAPEAQPFALPDLPVGISIDRLNVGRLSLEQPVTGIPAELTVDGRLSLIGGALDTDVSVERLDRPTDRIALKATYANDTAQIGLDLSVTEAEGGLVSELLEIPGRPSVTLTVKGDGPVGDFAADIALATAGVDRVTGQVTLGSVEEGGLAFRADLGGDVTPMLAESYRAFFGTDARLTLSGQRGGDGSLTLPDVSVTANALNLSGAVEIDGAGVLQRADLAGTIQPPEGETVVLPLGEPAVQVRGVRLDGGFDLAEGNTWRLDAVVDGLLRADVAVETATISAAGTFDQGEKASLDGTLKAALEGLKLTDEALQQAVGSDVQLEGGFASTGTGELSLQRMILTGADYAAQLSARIDGLESGFAVDGQIDVEANDLSRFAGLAGIDLGGAATLRLAGKGTPLGGAFDFQLSGQADGLSSGIAAVDPLIGGLTTLSLDARRDETGTHLRSFSLDGEAINASAQGTLRTGEADLTFRAALDDLGVVVPALPGPVTLAGDLAQRGESVTGEVRLTAPGGTSAVVNGTARTSGAVNVAYRAQFSALSRLVPALEGVVALQGNATRDTESLWTVTAGASGTAGLSGQFRAGFNELTGVADIGFDAGLDRIERLVPQIKGRLAARGVASRSEGATWKATLRTDGTAGIAGSFGATYEEPTGIAKLDFDAVFERLERLVPQLRGDLAAKGNAERGGEGHWQGEADVEGSAGLSGRFDANYDESNGNVALAFDAALARLERIVRQFPGTLTAEGLASRQGTDWTVDVDATGPGGIQAALAGDYDQAANRADLTARGQAQLGLANAFISPNSVAGVARFDLGLNGSPGLGALSGTVTTSGASVAIPAVAQALTGIDATVRMNGGTAQVSASGGVRAGGTFSANGSVGLEAPNTAAIDIGLNGIVLTDNLSYSTTLNGALRFSGPAAGGGRLSGRVDFGATEINVATASGAVSAAPIPEITHVGESAASRRTRARANLIETGSGPSRPIALDLVLNAPNRIFARGRGLDAELGGSIVVGGTTANVIPSGQISLIRGVFDILGRRLQLDEGRITMQGRLEPYLQFRASTSTGEGTATLSISGPVDAPVIAVTSVPERPSEEALALLLFGDKFTELSPLKIAQLGAQLATLAGGGGGILGNIRSGLGVDSLDVGTDDDGNAKVGVGSYISEKVYADVNVNAQGETEINLNLDLTDSLTLKGSVGNTGDTGVGLFFERDY